MLSPNLETENTTPVIAPATYIMVFTHAIIAFLLSLMEVLIETAYLLTHSPNLLFFILPNKLDKALNWAVAFSPFPRVEKIDDSPLFIP